MAEKPELKITVVWSTSSTIREIIVRGKGEIPAPIEEVLEKYGFEHRPAAGEWVAENVSTYFFARLMKDLEKHADFTIEHQYPK